MCAVPMEVRRGLRASGIRATNECELPHGCWELNLGPLGESTVLLTTDPQTSTFLVNFILLWAPTQRRVTVLRIAISSSQHTHFPTTTTRLGDHGFWHCWLLLERRLGIFGIE